MSLHLCTVPEVIEGAEEVTDDNAESASETEDGITEVALPPPSPPAKKKKKLAPAISAPKSVPGKCVAFSFFE